MLEEISFYLIFGKPLIMYLGILTLSGFLITALVAVMNRRGIHVIPFFWHSRIAVFSLACAIVHGILGVLLFF
ncbi:hypothetical protein [Methanoregula sp.]|uniref:hypothetical protein n=1 Tax=Methanoregula sp. TaxID=2052170 RepID=UPI003BB16736